MQSNSLLDKIKAAVEDNSAPLAREGALAVLTAVANSGGRVAEPYVVPLLDLVLERYADKVTSQESCMCMHLCTHVPWHRLGGLLQLTWPIPWPTKLAALLPCCKAPAFTDRHVCMHVLAWGTGQSLCCIMQGPVGCEMSLLPSIVLTDLPVLTSAGEGSGG